MQKAKIMASSPITSWQIDGETVTDFILWAPKSLQMETAAMKLKDTCSLEEKLLPTCMHANHFSHVQLFATMDYSLPGSSVLRILQARILECVSISFSSGSSWPMIEPASPALADRFFTSGATRKPMANLDNILESRDITLWQRSL